MSVKPRQSLVPDPPDTEANEHWGDGYAGKKVSSRQEVWNTISLQWERMTQPGGGGGGGGAVTVAEGADVAQGATTDADTASTVVGLLKKIKALLTGTLTVSGAVTADTELEAAAALADASANPTTPRVGAGVLVWNGGGWDRARGDIANGLDVDVTRLPALPAGTNNIGDVDVLTLPGVAGDVAHDAVDSGNPVKVGGKVIAAAGTPAFVSAVGDRANMAVDGAGRTMIMEPACWTLVSAPAANTLATASKAAGGAGVKHVLESLTAVIQALGTAPTVASFGILVRDGATGAGTIIWRIDIRIDAGLNKNYGPFHFSDLHIVGSANTAMTIEFTAAAGANTQETISGCGFDTL